MSRTVVSGRGRSAPAGRASPAGNMVGPVRRDRRSRGPDRRRGLRGRCGRRGAARGDGRAASVPPPARSAAEAESTARPMAERTRASTGSTRGGRRRAGAAGRSVCGRPRSPSSSASGPTSAVRVVRLGRVGHAGHPAVGRSRTGSDISVRRSMASWRSARVASSRSSVSRSAAADGRAGAGRRPSARPRPGLGQQGPASARSASARRRRAAASISARARMAAAIGVGRGPAGVRIDLGRERGWRPPRRRHGPEWRWPRCRRVWIPPRSLQGHRSARDQHSPWSGHHSPGTGGSPTPRADRRRCSTGHPPWRYHA